MTLNINQSWNGLSGINRSIGTQSDGNYSLEVKLLLLALLSHNILSSRIKYLGDLAICPIYSSDGGYYLPLIETNDSKVGAESDERPHYIAVLPIHVIR